MSDARRLTIEDFEVRAARWGAAAELWPDEDRDAAAELLSSSTEARILQRTLLGMERELALAAEEGVVPSSSLMTRILADAAEIGAANAPPVEAAQPQPDRGFFSALDRLMPAWRAAATCAASAVIGIWMGYLAPASMAEAATSFAGMGQQEMLPPIDIYAESGVSFALTEMELGSSE